VRDQTVGDQPRQTGHRRDRQDSDRHGEQLTAVPFQAGAVKPGTQMFLEHSDLRW
jgi:hypothetical protein